MVSPELVVVVVEDTKIERRAGEQDNLTILCVF